MATLTIRNLPDEVRDRLRVRAAQNGRSMEAEAREILADAFGGVPKTERQRTLREIQDRLRSLPGYDPNVSIVDEFLAEKRLTAKRELEEIDEWLKTPKSS